MLSLLKDACVPTNPIRFSTKFLLLACIGLASFVRADDLLPDIAQGNLRIGLEVVAELPDLQTPTGFGHAGDGSGRLFVSDTDGRIKIIDNGAVLATSFLDLSGQIHTSPGPNGLLGFALHPEYADPQSNGFGKLYTYHSEAAGTAPADFPRNEAVAHQNVVTEWQVDQIDPNQIDVGTRREIYRADHISTNHGGGMLAFGPDGYLYNAIGTPNNAKNDAQTLDNVYGKILRFDPIDPALTPLSTDPVSTNGNYRVPTNPFVNDPNALDEIYALGFRHHWRFSFDQLTGTLIAGDVGGSQIEEVDAVQAGENFGWPFLEGTFDGTNPPPNPEPPTVDPIAQYDHDDGRSVTGGYVYRGSIPELQGKYIFGDFTKSTGAFFDDSGRLFWIDPFDEFNQLKDSSEIEIKEFLIGPDEVDDDDAIVAITSFGEDESGEVYVLGINPDNFNYTVLKIVDVTLAGDANNDGQVTGADLIAVQQNFGNVGPPNDGTLMGDANDDGQVTGADLIAVQQNFGEVLSPSGGAAPEPSTAVCFGLIGVALLRRRRPV